MKLFSISLLILLFGTYAEATRTKRRLRNKKKIYRTIMGGEKWEAKRFFEYNAETNVVFFVGEQFHGTDLVESARPYWSCGVNYEGKGNGLIKYVMENSAVSQKYQRKKARERGFKIPNWATKKCYTAIIKPNKGVRLYANDKAPKKNDPIWSTTIPGTSDYVELDPQDPKLLFFLSWCPQWNNMLSMNVLHKGISQLLDDEVPPGDGTSEHDNGIRIDVAFSTGLKLSNEAKSNLDSIWKRKTERFSTASEAYSHMPDYKDGL